MSEFGGVHHGPRMIVTCQDCGKLKIRSYRR